MKPPNFYELSFLKVKDEDANGTIIFDPAHEIFKGHFPGQPVVPGVCMIQIVKDVLEKATGNKLLLQESKQIKFLQLLIPDESTLLSLELHWEVEVTTYQVIASMSGPNGIIFKFQGKWASM